VAHQVGGDEDAELDFSARLILDEIGVEYEDPEANSLDSIIERFGFAFLKTVEFSDLARLTLPKISAREDADAALMAWLDHEEGFPVSRLTLLAAKSTCKDRWRQVLPEGHRVWPKHLVTLEPAISSSQTDQMQAERVQLVIPAGIQSSYRDEQRGWLMSLGEF